MGWHFWHVTTTFSNFSFCLTKKIPNRWYPKLDYSILRILSELTKVCFVSLTDFFFFGNFARFFIAQGYSVCSFFCFKAILFNWNNLEKAGLERFNIVDGKWRMLLSKQSILIILWIQTSCWMFSKNSERKFGLWGTSRFFLTFFDIFDNFWHPFFIAKSAILVL